jgi:large subunit ribosomal protein L7/L12
MAAKISKEDVIEFIAQMTVLELSEFVKELEEKFGVTSAATVAVGVAAPVEQAKTATEQTEFKVLLTEVGNNKIQVIKVVRAITGLGLKEAKALVDSVPGTIKEGIPAEEAQGIKVQFEEVGAKVEIK